MFRSKRGGITIVINGGQPTSLPTQIPTTMESVTRRGVGGLSFAPRWGMVTPQEIERVDVMYGPFSAAYPGNSVGAVVVYVTQMPTAFNTHAVLRAWETSAALGNRNGPWAWRLDVDHADSRGQPLDWMRDPAGASFGQVSGRTELQSLYGQDAWACAPNAGAPTTARPCSRPAAR